MGRSTSCADLNPHRPLSELTGLDEAAPAIAQLLPSSMLQWLIARFANADSLVDRRDLRASLLRFVYSLLLVDHRRDVMRLIFRTLWPEHEWLVVRYSRVGVGIRVRHLLNAARGNILSSIHEGHEGSLSAVTPAQAGVQRLLLWISATRE